MVVEGVQQKTIDVTTTELSGNEECTKRLRVGAEPREDVLDVVERWGKDSVHPFLGHELTGMRQA